MFIVCLKNNIAVATAICKDLETAKEQFTVYDDIQEITAEEFDNLPIPSKLIGGKWEKTDERPVIDYPQTEKPTQSEENSIYDELAAAYREGVNEA